MLQDTGQQGQGSGRTSREAVGFSRGAQFSVPPTVPPSSREGQDRGLTLQVDASTLGPSLENALLS